MPKKNDIEKRRQTRQRKTRVLEALEKSLGVVTTACRNAEVSRAQFYVWLNEDEKFKKAVREMQDVALDFAESQLFKQIQSGVPSSTIFYLKTKGKNRGYVWRQEIAVAEKKPLSWFTDDSADVS